MDLVAQRFAIAADAEIANDSDPQTISPDMIARIDRPARYANNPGHAG